MMTPSSDAQKAEILKKFSNDNILPYLQKLVGIMNKITMQWYDFNKNIHIAKM